MTTTIRKKHPQRGFMKCNVPNCTMTARYINPQSKFKYCLGHFKMLKGKIVFGPGKVTKLVEL